MNRNTFPGFPHEATTLSAYLLTLDIFIISLKNEDIIRHTPEDTDVFRAWLTVHNIRDITDEAGGFILKFYAELPPDDVIFTKSDKT